MTMYNATGYTISETISGLEVPIILLYVNNYLMQIRFKMKNYDNSLQNYDIRLGTEKLCDLSTVSTRSLVIK